MMNYQINGWSLEIEKEEGKYPLPWVCKNITQEGYSFAKEIAINKIIVEIENPMPTGEDGLPAKTYSLDESFEKLWNKMEDHYGFDLRKL